MTYVIMITESRGREQRVCEKVSRRLEFLMAYIIINTIHIVNSPLALSL
jgi:hypothetical protein